MTWAVAVLDDKLEPLGKLGVVSSHKIHLILQLNDTLFKLISNKLKWVNSYTNNLMGVFPQANCQFMHGLHLYALRM